MSKETSLTFLSIWPSMLEMVGYYQGKLYMIPQYNYAMGLIYRTDLMEDPLLQQKFEATYGRKMNSRRPCVNTLKKGGACRRTLVLPDRGHGAGRGDPYRHGMVELSLQQRRSLL